MNYKCMDSNELEDNVCCGIARVLLSAPVRLAIILLLGKKIMLYIFYCFSLNVWTEIFRSLSFFPKKIV